MTKPLSPTLWRTCRALASSPRLKLLKFLLAQEESTVDQTATRCGMEPARVSFMLRQLQARGLLSARRSGRYTLYCATADSSVRAAGEVLSAIRAAMEAKRADADIIRTLTAFTHPRRIMLVRAIERGCARGDELREACSMSRPAFHRQIQKLVKRGFVTRSADGYQLARPPTHLAAELLRLACAR